MDSPQQEGETTGFASSTTSIRQTAKWLISGFVGFGALLIATLPLTEVGRLDVFSTRTVIAVVGGAAAAAAIATVTFHGTTLLTSRYTTLRHVLEIIDRENPSPTLPDGVQQGLARELILNGDVLYRHVATDPRDLFRRLRTAGDAQLAGRPAADIEALRAAALKVIELADHLVLRAAYKKFVKLSLWMGFLAILGAVGVAASLTSIPAAPTTITEPLPVRVVLNDQGRSDFADQLECDVTSFDAVAVGGSMERPVVAAQPPGCQAVRIELGPDQAVVIPEEG